jgi:hypothetical protein
MSKMIEVEIKTVSLDDVQLNPDNPRRISKVDMAKLVKSLRDFPEMLEMREVVVDEGMVVLGGNMRVLALREIGAKECRAKIVKGLTPEQKREFVIKDNAPFGGWDYDALANAWSGLPLTEWGVTLSEDWLGNVEEAPSPELKDGDREPFQQMTFTLHDEQAEDVKAAINAAKKEGCNSSVNENSNGNALAFICQRFNRG